MNNGYYPQGGNQGQQQQAQGDNFWPNVTGFKVGPSKSGKGHVVTLTFNSQSRSKNQPMTFQEFMDACAKAFQESGGFGVRLVLPFHQGNGPRGPFQSATIGVFPNQPPQGGNSFGGQRGGGRRQYPPRQQQGGYQQPPQQQGYYPPTQGMAPSQPQAPAQQGTFQQQGYAPQQPPTGGPTGPGPNAPTNAFPSEEDGPVHF